MATDMTAHVAESVSDVLVDNIGSVWLRANGVWRYITMDNLGNERYPSWETFVLSWDSFDRLPDAYEPYRAVDRAATGFILRAARQLTE